MTLDDITFGNPLKFWENALAKPMVAQKAFDYITFGFLVPINILIKRLTGDDVEHKTIAPISWVEVLLP